MQHISSKLFFFKAIAILYFVALCTSLSLHATTYYISELEGSDNFSGKINARKNGDGPFKTIKNALKLIKSGDTISFKKGTYYDQIYLYEKHNITILAFGDGPVTLSNTYNEALNWTKSQKGVYVAKLPNVGLDINKRLPEWYAKFNFIWDESGKPFFGYLEKAAFDQSSKNNIYCFAGDSVFLKIGKGDIRKIFATKSGSMINAIGCKNLTIDGGTKKLLQIKFGGRYGIALEGFSDGFRLRNTTLSDCSTSVYMYNVGGVATIDRCTFQNFDLSKEYIWQEIKAALLETTAIAYASGNMQLTIQNSYFKNCFNGIMAEPGYTKIYNNFLTNIGDDAIELDGPAIDCEVRDNVITDCFTAFSLCPVEKGPVYIYNNLITSTIKEYDFERLPDGSIRKIGPKTLKFWNLPDGNVLKDGVKQNVSGNVYFYYNTIRSVEEPFSIGAYGVKSVSPINAKFYNNIFYSDGVITNSTGFKADGIDIDNNVFYSSFKNKKEARIFIGWDGNNHYRSLPSDNDWSDNKYLTIKWNKDNMTIDKKTEKKLLKSFSTKQLSKDFMAYSTLNSRKMPGCKIELNKSPLNEISKN